ncbi:uncharacterized protein N0V89_000898 [Didymosphaeria variabile]|uniref:Uncharacterized protein n=1 Tax=Didymosphaeria variabile TaxID=1932322 RepID=A0A9W9CGA9_9PLEO|nr:uncharacterized protein N0V89_000898 [Didymosphaeria variabile]KAJ4360336.1 hypothetical protein N0V89_000898 [Didymosphaeria variabile]
MARPATSFSPFVQDIRPSPEKYSTPSPQLDDTVATDQPAYHRQILSLQPEQQPAMASPIPPLRAEQQVFRSGYQGQYAAQVAAPWLEHMDPALNSQSHNSPLDRHEYGPEDQYIFTEQHAALDYGLPADYRTAAEPFLTYASVQDQGQLSVEPVRALIGNGMPTVQQQIGLKFAMTEPLEVILPTDEELAQDVDAEGETEDEEDAEVGKNSTATEVPCSDPGYHSQTEEQQPAQPQQKLYIRFSARKKQVEEDAESKKGDTNTLENERKRPSTTSIEELTNEIVGGASHKRTRFERGPTEPKISSSPAPATKGKQKRQSETSVEHLRNEHVEGGPRKGARKDSSLSSPLTEPEADHPLMQNTQQGGRILSMQEQYASSPPLPTTDIAPPPPHRFSAEIPEYIIELFEGLEGQDYQVLPDIEDRNGKVLPWTAERLTLLYIHSYTQDNIELCDLITDVWIRAFQERNRTMGLPPMWRPNKHHSGRDLTRDKDGYMKEYGQVGLPDVPRWQQELDLPTLGKDVTKFIPRLLNQLYDQTAESNGARMLWADAIALCGTTAEDFFTECKKQKIEVHEGLIHNVMCTSLRGLRRNLTLKIEEVNKDSWCRRYHLHSKWGMECHRSKGKKDKEEKQAAQSPTHTAGGDGEMLAVQDDLNAAMLQGFEQEEDDGNLAQEVHQRKHLQCAGDAPSSVHDSAVDVEGGDNGDSSEEE